MSFKLSLDAKKRKTNVELEKITNQCSMIDKLTSLNGAFFLNLKTKKIISDRLNIDIKLPVFYWSTA